MWFGRNTFMCPVLTSTANSYLRLTDKELSKSLIVLTTSKHYHTQQLLSNAQRVIAKTGSGNRGLTIQRVELLNRL